MEQIMVYGGGGFAREVAWLIESCNEAEARYEMVCFVDDNPELQGQRLNDIRVMGWETAAQAFPEANVVVGIGNPHTREAITEKVKAAGFALATIIHPRAEYSSRVRFGAGTVVCAGNILTTNIQIGNNVHLNLDCTVGHDVVMGDYVTLAPGVHVSGWVHFGRRVYVGTGAVIINGTRENPLLIGDDVVIGAGACVTKSLPAGVTAVGVPGRPLDRR